MLFRSNKRVLVFALGDFNTFLGDDYMKNKIFLLLIGIGLIVSVIFLGIKSAENNAFVAPFGLACALIAPVGISCITSVFNVGSNETLKKLLKVPQIDELIQKAETQEEKIKLLEDERKQLSNIVKYETLKYAAFERRKHLEAEAENILKEYEKVEREIQQLNLEKREERLSNKVIDELYRKLENKENYQNTELLILSFFNAIPIRIPFLSSIALLSYNMLKQLFNKRGKKD